jgi:carnitine-CoA ligase
MDVWAARVEATPDAPFLRWEGVALTYAQAWERILSMAASLRRLGAGEDGRVASFLSNRPDALWAWFGAHAAGAVFVGLNREHRGAVLADMIGRSGARVLVTESGAADDLPANAGELVEHVVVVEESEPAAAGDPLDGHASRAAAGDLASILYTSGTTGRSKAVMLPHNQLARGGARFAESIGQRGDDRWHAWMPMSHIFGQLHVTMATVVSGGSLALYPRFSVSRFWDQVRDDGCTIFGGLGNMLRMIWHAPESAAHEHNGLRTGLVATPPPELRDPFASRFGVELVDSYGMTEAEPVTVPAPGTPPRSCGRENPDFELAVLADDGRRLGPGERGELAIRPREPDVMFKGYEGDDATTVAAWRDLWFHTGDVGMVDERGFYYLLDRRKDVIRTRGENVSPSEVEATLREHPSVRDCAVVGVPSDHVDDDVKAFVVLEDGAALELGDLRSFCESRMAGFMVPRHLEARESLPYSSLGKVDRRALAAEAAATPNAT